MNPNQMRRQTKNSSWAAVFDLAFGMDPDKLSKRQMYDAAIKAGADKSMAQLFARGEALTLAAVGQFAHETQQNIIAVSLQQQNALNDRTSYLAREVGRLWQEIGKPTLATRLWDAAAGSVIGQRIGLSPTVKATPAPAPFNPVPQGSSDPHADIAHPPEITLSGALTTAGFTFTTDSTASFCDRTGVVILKNESGSAVTMSAGVDLFTVDYHTPYAERPIVTAYVEGSGSSTSGLVGMCVAKNGGLMDGCTIESLQAASGQLPNNGTVKIRYFVQPAMPGA